MSRLQLPGSCGVAHRKAPDEELRTLLVAPDLAQRHGARAVPILADLAYSLRRLLQLVGVLLPVRLRFTCHTPTSSLGPQPESLAACSLQHTQARHPLLPCSSWPATCGMFSPFSESFASSSRREAMSGDLEIAGDHSDGRIVAAAGGI